MKTFVIGDIHGAHKALLKCLKISRFDRKQDRLICLGDVCDRGKRVKECINELLTIPNCIYILGNHDAWTLDWAMEGTAPQAWLDQGGYETVMSYKDTGIPKEHLKFFSEAPLYYVDNNKLFAHGGFDPARPLQETPKEVFLWDRNFLKLAQERNRTDPSYKFGNYDEIYLGHNPTINFGKKEPQKFCNVWAMDTGAGWGAKLTIMDTETNQFWQA
jgi:serine/threonine protein phosphatase 1